MQNFVQKIINFFLRISNRYENGLKDCNCLIWIMKQELNFIHLIFHFQTVSTFWGLFYLRSNRICKNTSLVQKVFFNNLPLLFHLPSFSFIIRCWKGSCPDKELDLHNERLTEWKWKQSVILAPCSQLIYTSTSFKGFSINPQKSFNKLSSSKVKWFRNHTFQFEQHIISQNVLFKEWNSNIHFMTSWSIS